MGFQFKQFTIDDKGCGMPVSTDGVLLGAWADVSQAQRVLDLGCGSGLLSLMCAQRSNAEIQAIDIDQGAINATTANISASPWPERVQCQLISAQSLAATHQSFDHIICNPPYFQSGLKSQQSARATARHSDSLPFAELAKAISQLLAQTGKVSVIVPTDAQPHLTKHFSTVGLQLTAQVAVSSVTTKNPQRQLLQFMHKASSALTQPLKSELTITDPSGNYTLDFIKLTKSFYLKL
ncbi:tRNA1(Val) (adenine(37)-N6)-methyltransferase [Paraferrimonas haliotis]|uniref:tRNA1(Val) (adenine(37)-N6)-methyltransferase n=1 Tax=Paraferrimonas haliotis TaxID=2013866 RepID=A0AA37TR06_9GAMM|nr:methyltransferase [Paraferrimonas haliotis]GLS83071.1 tRNA1(Val) (adenine(37)-N6)-methyltransferase [Paraferrimonas haliotis]